MNTDDNYYDEISSIVQSILKKKAEIDKQNLEKERKKEETKQLVESLGVDIGYRVKVIQPSESFDERMDNFIGYEGIVIKLNTGEPYHPIPNYEYYYRIHFFDETAKNPNGVSFHPSYIQNLGEDKIEYQTYQEKLQKEQEALRYRFGKCDVCGHPLGYYRDCVRCEKPKPLSNFQNAFNFLSIMDHSIANHSHLDVGIDDLWNHFIETKSFPNDSYQTISLEDNSTNEELNKVLRWMQTQWQTPDKRLFVWVSW